MTREEAIAHARYVRNKTKDASMICLDAEVIDALLSSPWHKFSEEPPKNDQDILCAIVVPNDNFFYGVTRYPDAALIHEMTDYWMGIPELELK